MRLTARAVTLSLCLSLTAALLAGCTSYSYKAGVRDAYPKLASRLDTLQPGTPAAAGLRDAAADPITYAKASAAWRVAAPVYRAVVSVAPGISDHRRADWLESADLTDTLNANERKHQTLIFWPAPTTQPLKP
jgi:hypothetical protein